MSYAVITCFREAKNTKSGYFKGVCIKLNIGEYEISIAYDNSAGATEQLKRGDIKIYDKSGSYLTEKIMGNPMCYATPNDIKCAIELCAHLSSNESSDDRTKNQKLLDIIVDAQRRTIGLKESSEKISKLFENKELISKYTERLKIMKENRSKADEENWSNTEVDSCDRMIQMTAEFITDLKKINK